MMDFNFVIVIDENIPDGLFGIDYIGMEGTYQKIEDFGNVYFTSKLIVNSDFADKMKAHILTLAKEEDPESKVCVEYEYL